MLEPPPDGISYVRQFDLTGQFWTWVEAATAGLQINAVIPDEVKFGPGELDVLVHCYGQHFTPTCVLYASDGINPAAPIPTSAYVNATEMTFVATPNQITQEILYTITVQDPAAVAPDPVLGAGAEPFRYVELLKVAGETIDRLGIVYVPPDMGLQIATDGALAARRRQRRQVWRHPRCAVRASDMGAPRRRPLGSSAVADAHRRSCA